MHLTHFDRRHRLKKAIGGKLLPKMLVSGACGIAATLAPEPAVLAPDRTAAVPSEQFAALSARGYNSLPYGQL
eukprot:7032297-Prymnesium_polylepis.1